MPAAVAAAAAATATAATAGKAETAAAAAATTTATAGKAETTEQVNVDQMKEHARSATSVSSLGIGDDEMQGMINSLMAAEAVKEEGEAGAAAVAAVTASAEDVVIDLDQDGATGEM